MPLIFANEYDKYENKIGKGIVTSFLSHPIIQDTVRSSISPVIGIVKNVKEIKDNVKNKPSPEMKEDLEIFKKIIEETRKNITT